MERPVFITHQSRRKPDTKERGRERAFLRAACAAQSESHHSAPLLFYGLLDDFGGIESSRLGFSINGGVAGVGRVGVLF